MIAFGGDPLKILKEEKLNSRKSFFLPSLLWV